MRSTYLCHQRVGEHKCAASSPLRLAAIAPDPRCGPDSVQFTVKNSPTFNGATNIVGTTVVGQLALTNNGNVYYLDLKK